MASMSADMEAQHHGAEFGSGPRPPPSCRGARDRSASEAPVPSTQARLNSLSRPPTIGCPYLRRHRLGKTPYTKNPRVIRANPKAHIEQSKRHAKAVLEDYNKRKKIKFELLDVVPIISMPESKRFYTHVNFTARPTKEGSQEQNFFAEIYHCGKRRAKNSFHVTCCEPLGPDSTAGSRFLKRDGASAVRKNVDFAHCFACPGRILHPAKGDKYIAGHHTIPNMYGSPVC